MTQDGRPVEWWPVEEPEQMANMLEYLEDENKPLHTNFVLPNQGLVLCYTCPVTGFWPQNEAAIAEFIHGPWPFGDLPEKRVQFGLLLP